MTIYTIRKYTNLCFRKEFITKHLISKVDDARNISVVVEKLYSVYSVHIYFESDKSIDSLDYCIPRELRTHGLNEYDKKELEHIITLIKDNTDELMKSVANNVEETKRIRQAINGGYTSRTIESKGDSIT